MSDDAEARPAPTRSQRHNHYQAAQTTWRSLKARLLSIQYGSAALVVFGRNFQEVDWDLARGGSLIGLHQTLRIGNRQDRQVVDADFDARQDQTDSRVKSPRPQPLIHKPGPDLLQMTTSSVKLSIV